MEFTRDELNHRTGQIVDAAMKVHTILGPGLLESAYKACMTYELMKRGFDVATEVPIPLIYEQVRMEVGFRADIVVDGAIVVELKCVDKLAPIHETQLLSHLKFGHFRVGLLINFHELRLKTGIRRRVHHF